MPVAAVCVAVHTGWGVGSASMDELDRVSFRGPESVNMLSKKNTGWAFRPKRGDGHWGSRWARDGACRASTGPQKHGAERRSGRCAWRFPGDTHWQEFEFYGPQTEIPGPKWRQNGIAKPAAGQARRRRSPAISEPLATAAPRSRPHISPLKFNDFNN